MTTLPQTTGIRLPRPAGATPLAVSAGLAPSHTSAAVGMTPADVWRVIRANMLLIVGMLVVACMLGYLMNLYLLNSHAKYTAAGYVQVERRARFNPLGKGPDSDYVDWNGLQIVQRTQASLLQTDSLLARVLQNANAPIRQTEWFKQFIVGSTPDIAAAKEDLADHFRAIPLQDTQLIRCEMVCPNKEDAKRIVENIVQQHLEDQQQINTTQMLDRSQALNNMKVKYETRMRELTDRRNNRLLQLNMGSVGTPGRYTSTDIELQSVVSKQIELASEASSAMAAYETLKQQISEGLEPAMVDEIVDRDMMVISYKDKVVGWDVEIKAAISQGKDSRMIREMEIKRAAFQEEYEKERDAKRISARNSLLSSAQSQAQAAKEAVDTANKKIEQLKGVLGDMAIAQSDYLTINDEITSTAEALKEVKEQLDSINSSNSQSQVSWSSRPVTPDSPSFPKLSVTMALAILMGLGLSLGIAFLREMMDTSVRSPRDIARVGQMNLLGMIPHEDDDPQSAGVPVPLVIFQAPTSMMAEQYRQVRTRLQHAASLDATRSILVTSPAPGDGKTAVACNLASGLALNGRKILLVDANFRRPELNKVFAVSNDIGFSNALASLDNFEGAIRSTQVPNLDVMTTGLRPANPTELMESQLFTDFIERALEEYDHVIFDTGPMLLASETTAMAPRVDGVISVVRAANNSRGLLQRLRDALRQVKAEHLGVVLNAVRSQGGGYYGRNIKTYYEYQNGHAA